MTLLTLLFISIGLALDAFAVSITNGFILKRVHFSQAIKIGFFFGVVIFCFPAA